MASELQLPRASLQSVAAAAVQQQHYHVRSGSSGGISQQVESAPAYVVDWDSESCERRFLGTADELRAEIDAGKKKKARSGTGDGGGGGERLFVVHGLPEDYVKALRASLDIDPAFIEAHAGRRRYRPLRWRRDATFAHYEYPELVRGYGAAALSRFRGLSAARLALGAVDFLDDPVIRSVSEDGDAAAVFCRASLWITARADVLLVDRPLWRDPASPLRKARRRVAVTKPYTLRPGSGSESIGEDGRETSHRNSWDVKLAEGEEIGSLEDVLQETLKDAADVGDGLMDIVSELAHDHWLDLFEVLAPYQLPAVHNGASLYWHVTQSLEQNLDVARYLARQKQQTRIGSPDWETLLQRTQRRVELLSTLGAKLSISKKTTKLSGPRKFGRESTTGASGKSAKKPVPGEENQRSLDRVSYLGGILLPFSIVSGILSMNEDFEPRGGLFWVFWAVSVPIAVLTMLVIYADIIRKAEVWVEVAADGVAHALAAAPMSAAVVPITIGEEDKPPRPPSQQSSGRMTGGGPGEVQTRIMPHAVTYSAGDEVVIDILRADDHEQAVDEVEDGLDEAPEEATMIVETPSGGGRPRAWRREQLGWYGACKAILGFRRPRDAADIPLGTPAGGGRRSRRQTSTY